MASSSPRGYIRFPAVAAIGWIPFYRWLEDVPPNDYTNRRTKVYDLLFDSGNRDPEDNLVDESGFRAILNSHDYRGALFLSGLEISRDQKGFSAYQVAQLRRQEPVGYTPLRYKVGRPPRKRPWPLLPERKGIGGSSPDGVRVRVTPERVTVTQRIDFRICRLFGIGGGILTLTFRDAPYAWMASTVVVEIDGSYRIILDGSSVPSQKLYVDWQSPNNCTYDMETASNQDMEQFFRAGRLGGVGRIRRAPQRPARLVYSGRLW